MLLSHKEISSKFPIGCFVVYKFTNNGQRFEVWDYSKPLSNGLGNNMFMYLRGNEKGIDYLLSLDEIKMCPSWVREQNINKILGE